MLDNKDTIIRTYIKDRVQSFLKLLFSETSNSMGNRSEVRPSDPVVSIIIPTRNSSQTLKKCLESVASQTYGNIEIMVIDNDSKDNSIQIAKSYDARIFPLQTERTKAKNFGVQHARGDFVLFLDSDMIMEPRVVTECVETALRSNLGGLIIPEKIVGTGFWIRVREFEKGFYAGTKIESARFFPKNIVLQVGGFDDDLIAYEESTLPQKIEANGYKVDERINSCIFHNEGKIKLRSWLSKKKYYSESLKRYKQRYKIYSHYQLTVSMRARLFVTNGNWITLVKHPLLTIGLVTFKILELISSRKI